MTGERRDLAQVDLRLEAGLVPFDAPEPNSASSWNGRDVLWLGPDEWLIVGEARAEAKIVDELDRLLDGRDRSIVDVSANRIVLDLDGGLDILASACGLDLDPRRWRPGMCAQTLLGQAQVILHQLDDRITRVFVRPSFAGYVEALLAAASA